jgi:hypothetical protein
VDGASEEGNGIGGLRKSEALGCNRFPYQGDSHVKTAHRTIFQGIPNCIQGRRMVKSLYFSVNAPAIPGATKRESLDRFQTWQRDLEKRISPKQDISVDLLNSRSSKSSSAGH